jgi:hypothetical protein
VKEHTAPAARVLALLVPDLRIGGEIAGLARVHNYGLIWVAQANRSLTPIRARSTCKNCATNSSSAGLSGVFFAPFELVPD